LKVHGFYSSVRKSRKNSLFLLGLLVLLFALHKTTTKTMLVVIIIFIFVWETFTLGVVVVARGQPRLRLVIFDERVSALFFDSQGQHWMKMLLDHHMMEYCP